MVLAHRPNWRKHVHARLISAHGKAPRMLRVLGESQATLVGILEAIIPSLNFGDHSKR